MKPTLLTAVAACVLMAASAVSAGTVTLTRVDPSRTTATPNSHLNTEVWRSRDNGRWNRVYHGPFYLTDGTDRYITYCLEQYVFASFPTDREVVTPEDMAAGNYSGVSRLNNDPIFVSPGNQQTTLLEDIGRLFNTAYHLAVDGETRAAFQLALWELADDDRDVTTGRLRYGDAGTTQAASIAQSFIDNLYTATLRTTNYQFYQNLAGDSSQLFVSAKQPTPSLDKPPAPVPLPLSGLMLVPALGALAALRRRKPSPA